MDNEAPDFTLPAAPRGLCFDRNDFLKTNFSVDNFLADHENVEMERIRDDLGVYLKVLRLAMIELINKDYANFVNLSATLIGFDSQIDKLQTPLEQLKEEIMTGKQNLEDAMKEVMFYLNKRKSLRQRKQALKYYSQTLNSLKTLNSMMKHLNMENPKETIILADRAVMHFNQLQFAIKKCDSLVKTEQKLLFNDFGSKLLEILYDLLFHNWKSRNEEGLLQTFTTLAALDKVSETEMLIRKQILAPSLHEIVSEFALQKSQDGLQGIYNKIINLLNNDFKLFLTVTQHSKLSFQLKSYQFLVNCFWCELEDRIEVNLSSIFAPGNPEIFYTRYNESMAFIKKLEGYCVDEKMVKLLHESAEYKKFQKRWNLPVYFQIRFQEIAGTFEAALQKNPTPNSSNSFLFLETSTCWSSLQQCWSDGIYIQEIAHKFWKLSLQLISRYATWVNMLCEKEQQTKTNDRSNLNNELLNNSINLYIDVQNLLKKLPQFLDRVLKETPEESHSILKKSLQLSQENLKGTHPTIKDSIVSELSNYYLIQLKQVSDIPRLYRKTNRSIPTKPCNYIDVVSKSVLEFRSNAVEKLDNGFLMEILETLFVLLTESYYKSVEDVLTSVQKTEDSLRRLKQIRERTPQQSENTGVTDGDKIRLQLDVDVKSYVDLVQSVHLNVNSISRLNEMRDMVRDAIKDIAIK